MRFLRGLSLIHIYYAGGAANGMEYRPYFMATRWVEMGHQVTVAASSFSHLRTKNPDLHGKKYQEEEIDGCLLYTSGPASAPTPPLCAATA